MAKSDALKAYVLDGIMQGGMFTTQIPTTMYLALYTVNPADDGTGGTEVAGGSYARVTSQRSTLDWQDSSGGSTSNILTIAFPTASAPWGTVVGFAFWTDPTAGEMLYRGSLVSPISVATSQIVRFDPGTIIVQEY